MAEADGNAASELRDERARLLDELSSSIPINVTENYNGTVNVSLDGIRLLRGTEIKAELSYQAGNDATPAIINIVDSENNVLINNINNRITSGSLGAVLEMGSSETGKLSYKNILNEVDKLTHLLRWLMIFRLMQTEMLKPCLLILMRPQVNYL